MPDANSANCSAAVQLVTATASMLPPRALAQSASNAATRSPCTRLPLRRAATTASTSSSSIAGRASLIMIFPGSPVEVRGAGDPLVEIDLGLEPEQLAGLLHGGHPQPD